MFLCAACNQPTTSATQPDGWVNWSCPCGRTCGILAPYGKIDLRPGDVIFDGTIVFSESFDQS
jgi:hypothetical protein